MSLFADDTKSFSESNIFLQPTLDSYCNKWLKQKINNFNPTKSEILTIKNIDRFTLLTY